MTPEQKKAAEFYANASPKEARKHALRDHEVAVAPQPEASGTVDRSALIEAATENIDNLVSRNGGAALSEIHRDLVYEEVAKCVDAIIRASARPGLTPALTEEERALVERWREKANLNWRPPLQVTEAEMCMLLAIIDRLTQEPKA